MLADIRVGDRVRRSRSNNVPMLTNGMLPMSTKDTESKDFVVTKDTDFVVVRRDSITAVSLHCQNNETAYSMYSVGENEEVDCRTK
jgi:hypothetical protein